MSSEDISIVRTKRFSCYSIENNRREDKRSRSSRASWRINYESGSARSGDFLDKHDEPTGFQTPALLIPTVGGVVPHLTPDIWETPEYQKVFVSATFDDVSNFHGWQKNVHYCLNQDASNVFVVLSLRSALNQARPDRKLETHDKVLSDHVADIQAIFRPNLWIRPGDPMPLSAGSNRNSTAVDRSAEWSKAFRGHDSLACAVGRDVKSVQACLRKMNLNSEDDTGIFFDVASPKLAKECLPSLDQQLLRGVTGGCLGPIAVLDLVASGFDLIESSYPQYISKCGYFSTYPIDTNDLSLMEWGSQIKTDARDLRFLVDRRPLVEGCRCFTCVHHTRAYVRHLVETREMLGETLLYAHNLFRFLQLVANARRKIVEGQFDEWYAAWCTTKQ